MLEILFFMSITLVVMSTILAFYSVSAGDGIWSVVFAIVFALSLLSSFSLRNQVDLLKPSDLVLTPIAIYCPEVEVCHSTIIINNKDTITIQLPSNNIKLNKTTKVNFSK